MRLSYVAWGEQRLRSALTRELPSGLERPIIVNASHDLALSRLRDWMHDEADETLQLHFQGSLDCLAALRRKQCDLAGFHLPIMPEASTLVAQLRPWLRLKSLRVSRLFDRTQGLMVAPGNPKSLSAITDLARKDVRFVNQLAEKRGFLWTQLLSDLEEAVPAGISIRTIHRDEKTSTITIDGQDITRMPMYRRARLGIGYLPQEASIFRGLTVEQNIMAVLELVEPNAKKRKEQLDSLLEEFHITRLRKSPSIALSGGERRRCEIARALATRPSFMLLDEPFAGIDPIAVGDIQQLVRHLTERGIGVLITDHNVRETLSLIDRAYIIYDGQVLTQGKPEEIIANEDVRRVYLGDMFG